MDFEDPSRKATEWDTSKFDEEDHGCCCCNCTCLKCMYRPITCTCDCYILNSKPKQEVKDEDLRKYLYTNWGVNGCQLFYGSSFQKELVRYFGLNIATYFMVMKILFIWVLVMFIISLLVFGASFYTVDDHINPATPVCRANYTEYYMCPVCDKHCDFWYLKQALSKNWCTRHFRLLFDNPVLWGFSGLVALSAVITNIIMIKEAKKLKKHESQTAEQKCQVIGSDPRDGNEHKLCSYGRCLIFSKYCWMVIYIIFIGGSYFLFLMLSLFIEIEVKKFLNRIGTLRFLGFILATVPAALLQMSFNILAKLIYKFVSICVLCKLPSPFTEGRADDCNCNEEPITKFLTLVIPNAITSYLPIIYRTVFFGNIVSDPSDGYKHIGNTNLRYQHCPSYGCMDVSVFVFTGMMGSIFHPAFYSFIKMFRIKLNCCNDKNNNSQSGENWDAKTNGNGYTENNSTGKTKSKSILGPWKSDVVDDYMDLTICYGYVLVFISVTGVAPLLAALIVIPITARSRAISYLLSTSEPEITAKKSKNLSLNFIWRSAFLFVTVLGIAANISFIIPSSRFLQHVSYSSSKGHKKAFLNFDEYLGNVLPTHNLTLLLDQNAFPDYTAHFLTMRYPNGKEVRDDAGDALLYLPFIDFSCLQKHFSSVGMSFTRDQYMKFITTHINNNTILQYQTNQALQCFNKSVTCRSRGFKSDTSHASNLKKTRGIFASLFIVPILLGIIIIIIICVCYCKK